MSFGWGIHPLNVRPRHYSGEVKAAIHHDRVNYSMSNVQIERLLSERGAGAALHVMGLGLAHFLFARKCA
jgi:hypothetical protein